MPTTVTTIITMPTTVTTIITIAVGVATATAFKVFDQRFSVKRVFWCGTYHCSQGWKDVYKLDRDFDTLASRAMLDLRGSNDEGHSCAKLKVGKLVPAVVLTFHMHTVIEICTRQHR